MLHKETVTKDTLDLIHELMKDERLNQFYLAGGTALALRIGHRISIDIDLFSNTRFDADKLAKYLVNRYNIQLQNIDENTVLGSIRDIKIDLIAHQYPNVKVPKMINGVRMASLEDIAAMKINAIATNGSRKKDFYDVYFLLRQFPLEDIMKAYLKKYDNVNEKMARLSLLYHQDIDFSVKIQFLERDIKWKEIAKGLKAAVNEYDKSIHSRKIVEQLKNVLKSNSPELTDAKRSEHSSEDPERENRRNNDWLER